MKKRSQISVEYALVIGFSLLVIIPIIIVFFNHTSFLKDRVNMNQADIIARKIIDASESVYYLGEPTFTVLKVSVPEKIHNITIANREIVINIETAKDNTDIVQISTVNITGKLSSESGIRKIRIRAYSNYVNITDASS